MPTRSRATRTDRSNSQTKSKVVGVGSVGTRCGVALLVTEDNDPLFLQIKEARASVLEP